MTEECKVCKKTIKSEDMVTCDGICNTHYHFKCLEFTSSNFKFYKEQRNVKYICDECENQPDAALHKTIKKILSYMCIMDERLNRQSKNIVNINSEIEKLVVQATESGDTINISNTDIKKGKTNGEEVLNKDVNVNEKSVVPSCETFWMIMSTSRLASAIGPRIL